jgi:RNA polymerase sigma factor (sigma-70 family)
MNARVDQHEFGSLLEKHQGILYKVANAYCRNREDRADLIQDMTVQLWRSFDRFDGSTRFSTWMYRIAMNVAISFYRSERRRIRDTVPVEECGVDIAAADDVSESASGNVRMLHQLIAQLDELDRALILLYLDGYAQEEIAGVIGITASNVSTRIGRLKQRLQKQFANA